MLCLQEKWRGMEWDRKSVRRDSAEKCSDLYIVFAAVSQLVKHICISGLFTGKEKWTKANGDRGRKQERDKTGQCGFKEIHISYFVLYKCSLQRP